MYWVFFYTRTPPVYRYKYTLENDKPFWWKRQHLLFVYTYIYTYMYLAVGIAISSKRPLTLIPYLFFIYFFFWLNHAPFIRSRCASVCLRGEQVELDTVCLLVLLFKMCVCVFVRLFVCVLLEAHHQNRNQNLIKLSICFDQTSRCKLFFSPMLYTLYGTLIRCVCVCVMCMSSIRASISLLLLDTYHSTGAVAVWNGADG